MTTNTQDKLKPCPCGKVPDTLHIYSPSVGKWAYTYGSCCGTWEIEFRTQYADIDSQECMEYAIAAWNEAPRIARESELYAKMSTCTICDNVTINGEFLESSKTNNRICYNCVKIASKEIYLNELLSEDFEKVLSHNWGLEKNSPYYNHN